MFYFLQGATKHHHYKKGKRQNVILVSRTTLVVCLGTMDNRAFQNLVRERVSTTTRTAVESSKKNEHHENPRQQRHQQQHQHRHGQTNRKRKGWNDRDRDRDRHHNKYDDSSDDDAVDDCVPHSKTISTVPGKDVRETVASLTQNDSPNLPTIDDDDADVVGATQMDPIGVKQKIVYRDRARERREGQYDTVTTLQNNSNNESRKNDDPIEYNSERHHCAKRHEMMFHSDHHTSSAQQHHDDDRSNPTQRIATAMMKKATPTPPGTQLEALQFLYNYDTQYQAQSVLGQSMYEYLRRLQYNQQQSESMKKKYCNPNNASSSSNTKPSTRPIFHHHSIIQFTIMAHIGNFHRAWEIPKEIQSPTILNKHRQSNLHHDYNSMTNKISSLPPDIVTHIDQCQHRRKIMSKTTPTATMRTFHNKLRKDDGYDMEKAATKTAAAAATTTKSSSYVGVGNDDTVNIVDDDDDDDIFASVGAYVPPSIPSN
jgi:hypothetical protein